MKSKIVFLILKKIDFKYQNLQKGGLKENFEDEKVYISLEYWVCVFQL